MATTQNAPDVEAAVDALVEQYRDSCLWFLDPTFRPRSDAARLRVLDHVQRHGDREAFTRAAELRSWLSQRSNAQSVDS